MNREEEYKIIAESWKAALWAVPKKPTCLFDKVKLMIMENPQGALEQNILDNNNDFWRKVYDTGTRKQKY